MTATAATATAELSKQATEGASLSMKLIKSLNSKGTTTGSSEGGSSTSNAGGNNSDNSALVSIGGASFGFNFDSEEGNSPPPSDNDAGNSNAGPKEKAGNNGQEAAQVKVDDPSPVVPSTEQQTGVAESATQMPQQQQASNSDPNSSASLTLGSGAASSLPESQVATTNDQVATNTSEVSIPAAAPVSIPAAAPVAAASAPVAIAVAPVSSAHSVAADAAVASLHSIASSYIPQYLTKDGDQKLASTEGGVKEETNGGYHADYEGANGCGSGEHPDQEQAQQGTGNNNDDDEDDGRPKKKKRLNDKKREERNAREKERSFRISKQINELRSLLSSGGVIVPKGTKSSVLTEAANYIRMLQQHQYRSEIDRHQLVQQIQMIGGGAHGPQAAQAIRHVAAKNGVWSLGNFGGVPPKSAMGYYQPGSNGEPNEIQSALPVDPIQQTKIEEHEYHSVFNNCAVGMAIASMGGAFIDCNHLFCQLSNYSKQEVCALTIFNMTARQDLQHAFDLISQLISPPMDAPQNATPQPLVLRGAMNNRNDLGLGVALVKGEDGIAKFFCVTLIKNPASPFDESKPIPATIELIQGTPAAVTRQMTKDSAGLDSAPAFTTG
ncbi:expressed unknown protein [Seminavis robusta]|uniref:BHLH domain-containing protein n=1 Tax=Seminavis robusta TaxID=568900 RepID=A0A9N8DT39_9STRA|nr:expressed unknown protein [Seminavis robusta]|eukprot:Sro323_g117240.1 n/a (609) ;mRNA; f:10824-12850